MARDDMKTGGQHRINRPSGGSSKPVKPIDIGGKGKKISSKKLKKNIKKGIQKAIKRAKMPRNYRAAVDAVSIYRQLRAEGKINKISSMEYLSTFVGKRGDVLKSKVKSAMGKERFAMAVADVKEQVGRRPGKKTLLRYEKAQREKREKATQTYVAKEVKDKRFKKKAREAASRYNRMVDTFATDTWNKLRDGGYGIGSDVVEQLVDEGLSPEEIDEYLSQIMETIDDIPSEARAMATSDDFWQAVIDMRQAIAENDTLSVTDVFNAYLTTEADNMEYFEEALQNYAELNNTTKSFSEVWEELQQTMDPASIDNMEEILNGGT